MLTIILELYSAQSAPGVTCDLEYGDRQSIRLWRYRNPGRHPFVQ